MEVRLLIGQRTGEIVEMKFAEAQHLIAAGHAELPDAREQGATAALIAASQSDFSIPASSVATKPEFTLPAPAVRRAKNRNKK